MGLAQLRLCASLLGDVMENEHHPCHLAIGVQDRRGAVLDGHFPAILGDQRGVVGQTDHTFFIQNSRHQVLGLLVGLFVDDPENALDRLADCFLGLPASQRHGDGIEKGNPACGVASDHRIADAGERYPQPFLIPAQPLFRPFALG